MSPTKVSELFFEVIATRMRTAGYRAEEYLEGSTALMVFGSMAVGLQRPDSDVDVLCIGERDSRLKTDLLDVIVLSEKTLHTGRWLHSELAAHVSHYGICIKGKADWWETVRLTDDAVEAKRRRVSAFMKSLPFAWKNLEVGFRTKYSVKVRREMQRLLLLERGVPIPPTRLLDTCITGAVAKEVICDRLRDLVDPRVNGRFVGDFLGQVLANWSVIDSLPER